MTVDKHNNIYVFHRGDRKWNMKYPDNKELINVPAILKYSPQGAGRKRDDVQRDFLKYTAQLIKKDMIINHAEDLKDFMVNAKDRKYQFWERNPLSVEIWSETFCFRS